MFLRLSLLTFLLPFAHASLFSTLATVPGTSNLENLAIRQTTGDILVTSTTSNILHQISHNASYEPVVIANITSNTALLGITELQPDIFYFMGSNISGTAAEVGSNRVWKIDLTRALGNNEVELVAKFEDPETKVLNGMTRPSDNEVLISDSGAGTIIHLNLLTVEHSTIFSSPLFLPNFDSGIGVGINGIHIHEEFLYFTSLDQEIFGRIPIHNATLGPEPVEILAKGIVEQDDFALLSTRNGTKALISSNGHFTLTEVDIEAKTWKIFANETVLQDASSVALGRCDGEDGEVDVYVTGSKNLSAGGNETIGRVSWGRVRL